MGQITIDHDGKSFYVSLWDYDSNAMFTISYEGSRHAINCAAIDSRNTNLPVVITARAMREIVR
jgi:hypothetical protein